MLNAALPTGVTRGLAEYRSSLENPQVPLSYPAEWLLDIFNGGRTDSGIRVSEMTALQVGTVYACVNIISNGFASMPLNVYERLITKAGRVIKKKAFDHSLMPLLNCEPNVEMTTFTWLKTMMIHDLLWGNAFTEIQRDGANQIIGLWPRNPARTRAIRCLKPLLLEGTIHPAGTLIYETTENLADNDTPSAAENTELHLGKRRLILAEDMIHVPGMSLDGRVGQSTIWLSRQIIGLALATEKYGAKFFGNGARPAGILKLPNKLEEKAIENLRRSWAEAHGGENQFKVAVLEQGIEFQKIAATPEEGQMLGTRNYQRSEICSVFNVPLHMVASGDAKSGKSNVEQNSIEFVLYCLTPWITAWEKELQRKLFPKMGRTANKFVPKFDKRHLLYPDADSRAKFYASGRQWGYLSKNDVLDFEDMNPDESPAGDVYMVQVNMQNDQALVEGGAADGAKPPVPKAPAPVPVAPAAAAPAAKPAKGKASQAAGKGKKPARKSKRGGLDTINGVVPLYVMRHGTTDANEQDVYRGWGNYELDVDGVQDAEKAAAFLKDKGITHIVTSTLPRHKQTAGIVSRVLGSIPVEYNDDFRTLNVGLYTGKKRADFADELEWYLDHPDEKIPGGESPSDFVERNERGFARARSMNELSGPTLVITSRSNVSALASSGVTGAEVKVAEPGGVYRLDGVNTLELIYGDEIEDTLAGT
jgi:HK97 family phage portal protein